MSDIEQIKRVKTNEIDHERTKRCDEGGNCQSKN